MQNQNNKTTCTRCGASMDITTIGTMEDKVHHCPFCGHVVDIADSFSTTEIDETETTEGSKVTKTKRTVIKQRSDGPIPPGDSSSFGEPDTVINRSNSFSIDPNATPEEIRRQLEQTPNFPKDMIDEVIGKLSTQDGSFTPFETQHRETTVNEETTTSYNMSGVSGTYDFVPRERLLKDLKTMNPTMSESELEAVANQLQPNGGPTNAPTRIRPGRVSIGINSPKELLSVLLFGALIVGLILFFMM